MNKYVKEFLKRGMAFGGFGPIVAGIVYWILSLTIKDFALGGGEILLAIVSTYLLAFLQAGTTVFHQIEHWPLGKSLFFHFFTLYLAYTSCYLLNTWIPFEPLVLLIFSAIFIAAYLVVWLIVVLSIKTAQKKLNKKLK